MYVHCNFLRIDANQSNRSSNFIERFYSNRTSPLNRSRRTRGGSFYVASSFSMIVHLPTIHKECCFIFCIYLPELSSLCSALLFSASQWYSRQMHGNTDRFLRKVLGRKRTRPSSARVNLYIYVGYGVEQSPCLHFTSHWDSNQSPTGKVLE